MMTAAALYRAAGEKSRVLVPQGRAGATNRAIRPEHDFFFVSD
jgi:hypothetical protein